MFFVGFALSCANNQGAMQPSDTGSETDTCTCSTDQECQAQAQECMTGVCKCTCSFFPSAKGTVCDDKKADTDPDTCDGNGKCTGIKLSCGDHKCSATQENCLSCPQDCACQEGDRCLDGVCEKLPSCNDNVCQKGENCASCPADCPCDPGTVCFKVKGECLDCANYCKKAKKDCGVAENGCNCGACQNGKTCNALGKCQDSSLCGNGTCEATEDCAGCPQDCACPKGEACIPGKNGAQAQCQDCTKVCADNNRECGSIFSCDCGGCSVCHHCYQGKCVGKQSCLCYNKECGTIEGFDCGKCADDEECIMNTCMKGCKELCSGKECGWSGTGDDACFCGFCDGCTQCDSLSNKCVPAATNDDNEPNNMPDKATEITGETGSINTSLYPSGDDDWYRMHINNNSSILFKLSGLASDKDYDLVECLKCDNGVTKGDNNLGEDKGVYKIDPLITGAVCYASINLAGEDEMLRVIPKCDPMGGTYYIGVLWGTDATDCGSAYTLEWSH